MKIALCASEVVPFAKTGGLADVAGALPQALEKAGADVIIIMPKYKGIEERFKLVKASDNVIYTLLGKKIKVYFIKNEAYFNRDALYGTKTGDYEDNLGRFSYFSRKALALLKEIKFKADVIHVHDWQAGLIPVYLKTELAKDPFYKNMRALLTIHNLGYQGLFEKEEFPKLGLSWDLFAMEGLEFFGRVNILKGGIIFSDIVNTVSPTYSKEIRTKRFGFGLEGVLEERKDSLFGILNGIDYSIWNPEQDEFITEAFSANKPEGKLKNKEVLQKACSLRVNKDIPLIGMVSRLAEPKGFDIICEAIDEICSMKAQVAILGTGDEKYHEILARVVKKYPKSISLNLRFDDPLAHKIYAGSDIFLMPSNYEPCGLGQLIAFRYGSIPLVFKTGGLADTVKEENGFVFEDYNKVALVKTVRSALELFKDKKAWGLLVKKAMQLDFSWKKSAMKYLELYAKAKAK
ncbi:MAG: glycogen synthase GlgA [Candidatus Omnitrophota bacterium]|jgi:starch synthase